MKKPLAIAVVGSKSSGKTTTIETLTRKLTKKGYKIAAIKHIPEPNFTIDHAGKDTWRFAQSGAKTIISVSSNEIAIIEKANMKNFSLKEILKKCKGHDIIFIEGFRKIVGKDKSIYKIVVTKSAEEASEAVKNFEPLLAFTGPYSTEALYPKIPYVNLMKNPEKIAEIVERVAKGFLP
ncbi:MAG: molybdopterin-guanine dinucleotide biosynthesis protein B [Candidatus Bathyarchaeia archaeon]